VRGDEPVEFNLGFSDRTESYGACIVAGARDVVRKHRDPRHSMRVSPDDALYSLRLALAAQAAVDLEGGGGNTTVAQGLDRTLSSVGAGPQ
jgi:hypothetical protein